MLQRGNFMPCFTRHFCVFPGLYRVKIDLLAVFHCARCLVFFILKRVKLMLMTEKCILQQNFGQEVAYLLGRCFKKGNISPFFLSANNETDNCLFRTEMFTGCLWLFHWTFIGMHQNTQGKNNQLLDSFLNVLKYSTIN